MEDAAEPVRLNEAQWPSPEDDGDRHLLEDVRTVGWHVIGIEADDDGPALAYTVGLHHSFGHPELVAFGLPIATLFGMLNALGEAVKAGQRFRSLDETDRALEEYQVLLLEIDPRHYREHLGYARWFYRGNNFAALQCVWPDAQQRYPTDPEFAPQLAGLQPLLTMEHAWPFHAGKNRVAFVTRPLLEENRPVLLVSHDPDGDWQFLCGTTNETSEGRLVSLGNILEIDPTLSTLADLPTGWQASRSAVGEPWQRVRV
jgi:hypothetical protein